MELDLIGQDSNYTLKDLAMVFIFLYLFCGLLLNNFRITNIEGNSMQNTLQDGEKHIISILPYKYAEKKRLDIVIVERKDLSVSPLVKRIIGLPGETIEIKSGKVLINGEVLDEPYIKEPMYEDYLGDMEKIQIPEGKVFVMGDNRNFSMDSREKIIGLVDIETEIFGKLIK